MRQIISFSVQLVCLRLGCHKRCLRGRWRNQLVINCLKISCAAISAGLCWHACVFSLSTETLNWFSMVEDGRWLQRWETNRENCVKLKNPEQFVINKSEEIEWMDESWLECFVFMLILCNSTDNFFSHWTRIRLRVCDAPGWICWSRFASEWKRNSNAKLIESCARVE